MSPNGKNISSQFKASNNIYTIILAFAFAIVLATAAFAAYNCYFQYGTFFEIP